MSTTPPTPRRKLHLMRWFVLLFVAIFAWGGWREFAFRSALKEAKALGWYLEYADPVEVVRADWRAAFEKETWTDGVRRLDTQSSEMSEQHISVVHRLNPKHLRILDASTLRDLSYLSRLTRLQEVEITDCTGLTNLDALKSLSALQWVTLSGCTGLTNLDGLKNLSALQELRLYDCPRLTNMDGIENLPSLQMVALYGCTGLTNVDALKSLSGVKTIVLTNGTALSKEDIAALEKALPNAEISTTIPGL